MYFDGDSEPYLQTEPLFTSEKEMVCRNIDKTTNTWSAYPPHTAFLDENIDGAPVEFVFELKLFCDANISGFALPLSLKNGFAHFDGDLVNVWMDFYHYDKFDGTVAATYLRSEAIGQTEVGIVPVPLRLLGQTHYFNVYAVATVANEISQYGWKLEIEADSYWEYDPGDGGGPIYDKDTGAQLRAFP